MGKKLKQDKSPTDTGYMNFSLGTSQLCDDTDESQLSTPKKGKHEKNRCKTLDSSQQEFVDIKEIQTPAEFLNKFQLKKSTAKINCDKSSDNEQNDTDFEEIPDIIENSQPPDSTPKNSLKTIINKMPKKKKKNLLKCSDQEFQVLHKLNESILNTFNESNSSYEDNAMHKSVTETSTKKNKHRKHNNSNSEENSSIIENSSPNISQNLNEKSTKKQRRTLSESSDLMLIEPSQQNEGIFNNINAMKLSSSTQDSPKKKNKKHKKRELETTFSQLSQHSSMITNQNLLSKDIMDEQSSFYTQFENEVHMKTSTQNVDTFNSNSSLNCEKLGKKKKKERKHSESSLQSQELTNLNLIKEKLICDLNRNTSMGSMNLESNIEDLNCTPIKKKKLQKDEISDVIFLSPTAGINKNPGQFEVTPLKEKKRKKNNVSETEVLTPIKIKKKAQYKTDNESLFSDSSQQNTKNMRVAEYILSQQVEKLKQQDSLSDIFDPLKVESDSSIVKKKKNKKKQKENTSSDNINEVQNNLNQSDNNASDCSFLSSCTYGIFKIPKMQEVNSKMSVIKNKDEHVKERPRKKNKQKESSVIMTEEEQSEPKIESAVTKNIACSPQKELSEVTYPESPRKKKKQKESSIIMTEEEQSVPEIESAVTKNIACSPQKELPEVTHSESPRKKKKQKESSGIMTEEEQSEAEIESAVTKNITCSPQKELSEVVHSPNAVPNEVIASSKTDCVGGDSDTSLGSGSEARRKKKSIKSIIFTPLIRKSGSESSSEKSVLLNSIQSKKKLNYNENTSENKIEIPDLIHDNTSLSELQNTLLEKSDVLSRKEKQKNDETSFSTCISDSHICDSANKLLEDSKVCFSASSLNSTSKICSPSNITNMDNTLLNQQDVASEINTISNISDNRTISNVSGSRSIVTDCSFSDHVRQELSSSKISNYSDSTSSRGRRLYSRLSLEPEVDSEDRDLSDDLYDFDEDVKAKSRAKKKKRRKSSSLNSKKSVKDSSSSSDDDEISAEKIIQKYQLRAKYKSEDQEANNKNIIARLKNFYVKPNFQVHKQHTYESSINLRGFSDETKKLFKGANMINSKKFTPEEDEIIMKNWKIFAKIYKLDINDGYMFTKFMRNGVKLMHPYEFLKFSQFLGQGLQWRPLQSIHYRFSRFFTNLKLSSEKFIKKSTQPYTPQKNSQQPKIVKPKLNIYDLEKALKLIMAASGCKTVQELDNIQIPWYKVKQMDPANFANTRKIWWSRLYTELHIKKAINVRYIEMKLVEILQSAKLNNKITSMEHVNWKEICRNDFPGFHHQHLATLFYDLRKCAAPSKMKFSTMLNMLNTYLLDDTQHSFGIIRPLLTKPDGTVINYQEDEAVGENTSSKANSDCRDSE